MQYQSPPREPVSPGSPAGFSSGPASGVPPVQVPQQGSVLAALPRLQESELAGTRRWADELWMICHHERTGRPQLGRRHLGMVVGAGLLAELVAVGAIAVDEDGMVGCLARQPRDPLAAHLLAYMDREPELRPVGDWLAFLAAPAHDRGWDAPGKVADRLGRDGFLVSTGGRRRGPGWAPRNPDCAFVARMRAARPLGQYGSVLTALAYAGDLHFRLKSAAADAGLPRTAPDPGPQFAELIIRTEVAVSSAVLSQRT